MATTTYPDLDACYSARQARRTSPEADYGVFWSAAGTPGRWRVSYIQDTGEIYAVHLDGHPAQVVILGHVPADTPTNPKDIWYSTLETILDGWAEECLKPNSLSWLQTRLEQDIPHGR